MGYPQGPTLVRTDDSPAKGFINKHRNKQDQEQSKWISIGFIIKPEIKNLIPSRDQVN